MTEWVDIMVIDSYDMSKQYVNDLILPWCQHATAIPGEQVDVTCRVFPVDSPP